MIPRLIASLASFLRDLRDLILPPPEAWRDPGDLAREREAERDRQGRGFPIQPSENSKDFPLDSH